MESDYVFGYQNMLDQLVLQSSSMGKQSNKSCECCKFKSCLHRLYILVQPLKRNRILYTL